MKKLLSMISLIIHDSPYAKNFTFNDVLNTLRNIDVSGDKYKTEFVQLTGQLLD